MQRVRTSVKHRRDLCRSVDTEALIHSEPVAQHTATIMNDKDSDTAGLETPSMGDLTLMLRQWRGGDEVMRNRLLERIYADLTRIAARQLAEERFAELEPQGLVHEAFLRIMDLRHIDWRDRAHFFALAATTMRQVLVDTARRRQAAKRDGGLRVTLTGLQLHDPAASTDVLAIHAALENLGEIDPPRARLVELRYFGGLTVEETAEVLKISPATVKRQWEVARAWLYRALSEPTDTGA